MDLDALEEVLKQEGGKVKLVYTVPVHHNPTGITRSNDKRARLLALAKQYDFKVLADEAYCLLSFSDPGVVSLHFHDDANDPRVIAVGTFSKLIGPGIKVGWVHAYPGLLKPLAGIGFIDSGNNLVIFNSSGREVVSQQRASKTTRLAAVQGRGQPSGWRVRHSRAARRRETKAIIDVGLEPYNPEGEYFVWVTSKGKVTGRSGKGSPLRAQPRGAIMTRAPGESLVHRRLNNHRCASTLHKWPAPSRLRTMGAGAPATSQWTTLPPTYICCSADVQMIALAAS